MKTNKIVVFGGSFNPLTKAHGEILKRAIKKIDASLGILLPASNHFIHDWKSYEEDDVLPLELRLKILNEFQRRNKNITIETIELDGVTSKTYDSLTYLKKKYNSEMYFLLGNEKYNEIVRWYRFEDILKEHHIILVKRENVDLDKIIEETPLFKENRSRIVPLDVGDKFLDVSSSRIRNDLKDGNFKEISALTYRYVVKLLKRELKSEE